MGLAIGIDLGTTNSCVAVVHEGKARVIQDSEGASLQPSVVSFHPDGRILVGREARERQVIDPQNTFFSVKRLIGRDYSDPEVRQVAEKYPYTLVEGPNGIPLAQARGKEYTLPEISSLVLAHLREISQESFGDVVEGVVITVPANFNDVQRSSTRVAGRIADLEVLRILNEPTAAALAYGYGQGLSERIAVYDFGGGTFDITILDLRENVFEVLATAGDMFLGGDDLDARLVDQMVAAFVQLHQVDLRNNPIAMQRLRSVGEQIKCQLSSRSQVSARIRELEYGPGGKPLDMNFAVTRDGFEQRITDLVDRSFEVCDEALRLAEMSPAQLDNVILVGGTTRVPYVRQRVLDYFGRDPRSDINPDEVVAIGAAIQAYALVGQQPSKAPAAGGVKTTQPGMGGAAKTTQPGLGRSMSEGKPFPEDDDSITSATAPFFVSPPTTSSRTTQRGLAPPPTGATGAAAGVDGPTDESPALDFDDADPTTAGTSPLSGGTLPSTPATPGKAQHVSGAAAAFGGELPDDLPSPGPAGPGRPPAAPPSAPPTGAAAAFGGELPDDLPSPQGAGAGSADLPAPRRGGPPQPPQPPGGAAAAAGAAAAGGAAAAFGGTLPDDLPSPREDTSTESVGLPVPKPGGGEVGLPTPLRPGGGASPGRKGQTLDGVPPPAPGVSPGAPPPAPPPARQGGAPFDGDPLGELPSAQPASTEGPPDLAGGLGGDEFMSGSFNWGGPADAETGTDAFSEHSVIGTITEEMMAPASIGRPPPTGSGPAEPPASPTGPTGTMPPVGAPSATGPTAPLSTQEMGQSPFEEGTSWDVLSMPGAPNPKIAPAAAPTEEYVDSSVSIPSMPTASVATGASGVSAPGVAPLPPHLLQELGINHVLIDVTPRTLAIQTVEGFCDPIIERNSPIPIDQSRIFTTSKDEQTTVNIKICQGESRRIEENIVLGEVTLSNIRPAPRGDVRIAVTFEIDTDGIVNVNARDVDTGHFAQTKVTVFGGLAEDEVRDMLKKYGRQ